MNEAGLYRCPSCGAPADVKAAACSYCRAALHPVRCPWCFEWTDQSAKGCARCGSAPEPPAADVAPLSCPTCRSLLSTRVLGGARLSGCAACGGVWADSASFKKLCEDRATQAAYMGQGSALPHPLQSDPTQQEIMYRPCPVCADLMNRFNFAGCSGVILDMCKPHGVWFDADELRRIVEFIRGGGLDVARGIEKQDLEDERRRLESATADARSPLNNFSMPLSNHADHIVAVVAARALLSHLWLGDDA